MPSLSLVGVFLAGLLLTMQRPVDCQTVNASALAVTLETVSNTAIQVSFFLIGIGGATPPTNVAYTVYYACDLMDPSSFSPTTPNAMTASPVGNAKMVTLTSLPVGSDCTVVVLAANNDDNTDTKTSPPETKATFGSSLSEPQNLQLSRQNNNTTLVIQWQPPATGADVVISYEVEYRVQLSPSVSLSITTFSTTQLSATVMGLNSNSNYEVRVRGHAETSGTDVAMINTEPGPWTVWVVSQVRIITGPVTGGGASMISCSAALLTVLLASVLVVW